MLDTHGRKWVDPVINFIRDLAVKYKISPNAITLFASLIGCASALLILGDQPIFAALVLWISGGLDAVDGAVARKTGQMSAFGTLLDITLDRVVEMAVILALALRSGGSILPYLVLMMAILLSMTIFLTVGAISEKSGMKSFRYQTGMVERTEGFIGFTVMIVWSSQAHMIAWIMAALIGNTAIQRLMEAKKILGDK